MEEFIFYCSMLAAHLLYNGKKTQNITVSKMAYNLDKLLLVFSWIFFYKVMTSGNSDGAVPLLSVLTWTQ